MGGIREVSSVSVVRALNEVAFASLMPLAYKSYVVARFISGTWGQKAFPAVATPSPHSSFYRLQNPITRKAIWCSRLLTTLVTGHNGSSGIASRFFSGGALLVSPATEVSRGFL
jgi:hypothetical protein